MSADPIDPATSAPVRDLTDLRDRLRAFAAARDWEQFHSPKNLAMALVAEAAELVEHFQWLTEDQSRELDPAKKDEVAGELADVLAYLVRIADRLDIDLLAAATAKLAHNERRYPADRVRGSARKYDEY
jgi:NTP pyrophosphatase (non-canonical NTP hydrolase)